MRVVFRAYSEQRRKITSVVSRTADKSNTRKNGVKSWNVYVEISKSNPRGKKFIADVVVNFSPTLHDDACSSQSSRRRAGQDGEPATSDVLARAYGQECFEYAVEF
jgi:hypothetical protein